MTIHVEKSNPGTSSRCLIWLVIFGLICFQTTSLVWANTPTPNDEDGKSENSQQLNAPPLQPDELHYGPFRNRVNGDEFYVYIPLLFSQLEEISPFLDLWSRETVDGFFTENYLNAPMPAIGWNGNLMDCIAGTLTAEYQAAVLQRINFYRRMAGVPDQIIFNTSYNEKAQAAALIMARNNKLTHYPPDTWLCYSVLGYSGASSSNLALGVYGWSAINLYIKDPGGNNGAVGHRRWVLYPQTQQMGLGDIPPASGYSPANSLVVFDDHMWDARPETRDNFVAWPPSGYVPYQIVFPRWSFSYPGASFSSASVTMTINENSVPLVTESITNGYGENTLVWLPYGLNSWDVWIKPAKDMRYTISVLNVYIQGEWRNFSYDVIVFDPTT